MRPRESYVGREENRRVVLRKDNEKKKKKKKITAESVSQNGYPDIYSDKEQ